MSPIDCSCGSALLTDYYQLSMIDAYLAHGHTGTAVFEFFVRSLPEARSFLLAAGLEQVLQFLEGAAFKPDELSWLADHGRLSRGALDWLAAFRFTGDVDAVAEGCVVFPEEPLIRVTAPLPMAQLVETRLMNLLHYQTLIASKAARMVLAAPGRLLVDFGLRRAHGAEAGLMAARASYVAGFGGTATVAAGRAWNIPLYGTMAHAFVQAFDDETEAFERFARARPDDLVLLIDTYDTLAAAGKVVALAQRLRSAGIRVRSVRIDSGDLLDLSRRVRTTLDAGGLHDTGIFVSGGLDETDLRELLAAGAPIDGFGVGTALSTSLDAPALDCAYKLQEYAGVARRKLSPGRETWPGRKQVWRSYDAKGIMQRDLVALEGEAASGEPLLRPVMRNGVRTAPAEALADTRARAAQGLATLPKAMRSLQPAAHPVVISPAVRALAGRVDARRTAGRADA
jgi:nicotinate phosphoribosyltransferase